MTFAHPILLWVAAACAPVLALFFVWSWRTRRRLIGEFVPKRLQAALTLGLSPRRARFRALLLIGGLALLMIALARPRFGIATVEVSQRGLDILIAIDASKSMLAEDAGPGISRLQRAKLAALDLARLAKSDRVGLIAFAGSAFLQCPLTIDDDAFRQSVDALDVDIIPEGGTSFGPAIRTALEAQASDSENVRVLVLFTDGEEHESSALAEAEAAKEKSLKIFTVGVGTTRGEIIRVRGTDGNPTYLKDSRGNVVKSALNEPLLQDISQRTGGFYIPLQGPRAIEELYHRGLEPLPRSELKSRTLEQFHERFQIPLLLALLVLAAEFALPECARPKGNPRPAPRTHPTIPSPQGVSRAAAALIALLGLALGLAPRAAHASPGSALRHYKEGKFSESLEEYEKLAARNPEDPRLHFNAGAAAFRAEDYERASRHFSNTLRTPDLKLQRDAFYNLGNALFEQGSAVQDPNARRARWEASAQSLDAALSLAPENSDTRHNLDYVRKRLEELKQQQQQQKQQKQDSKDKNKEDDKDKQEQEDQQDGKQDQQKDGKESEDQKDSQEKDSSQPQDSDQDNQDPKDPKQSKSEDGDSQDKGDQQKPESGQPQDNQKGGQQDSGAQGQQGESDPARGDPGAEPPQGQMSPQQAFRLLDAAKGEERPIPLEKRRAKGRIVKDW